MNEEQIQRYDQDIAEIQGLEKRQDVLGAYEQLDANSFPTQIGVLSLMQVLLTGEVSPQEMDIDGDQFLLAAMATSVRTIEDLALRLDGEGTVSKFQNAVPTQDGGTGHDFTAQFSLHTDPVGMSP